MKKLHCIGCGKVAAVIEDGSIAKGMIVRCHTCELKLQTNIAFLTSTNRSVDRGVKPANLDGIFGDLFSKK